MSDSALERRDRTAQQVKIDLESNLLKRGISSVGTGLNHSSDKLEDTSWLKKNGPRLQISKGPKPR